MEYITCVDAKEWIKTLQNESIDLLLMDPPYFSVVSDGWDNQWKTKEDYVNWMFDILKTIKPKLKPKASVLFFGGVGKHGCHPFYELILKIEKENLFYYRNMITWKKKRAYGKQFDYLFTREEIVWFSMSEQRTEITFNIPYLNEKRGYEGFNKKYKAKSEFLRVSNVFTDINELFKTERICQKPIPLMKRLIETHSNENDLVVDLFAGTGATGIAALELKRRFSGCEIDKQTAEKANEKLNLITI